MSDKSRHPVPSKNVKGKASKITMVRSQMYLAWPTRRIEVRVEVPLELVRMLVKNRRTDLSVSNMLIAIVIIDCWVLVNVQSSSPHPGIPLLCLPSVARPTPSLVVPFPCSKKWRVIMWMGVLNAIPVRKNPSK